MIKEPKLSPKKQSITKSSTNPQAKSAHCRKINSPNAKKSALIGCKSPNYKKTASPMAPENIESGSSVQLLQESIQTAKKLRRIIETNVPSTSSNLSNQTDDAKRTNMAQCNKIKSQKSHMLSKPIKKQKRAHEFYDSGDEGDNFGEQVKKVDSQVQQENANQNSNIPTEIQWTREEDRLLLEQIRAGIDSHIENITGFADRFPHKTQEQIRNRIDFLIDFLTKLRRK